MSGGYQLPPKEIMEFVDAPQTPAVLLSPKRDKIAFLERSSSLLESARPEIKIAGLRIDPVYNTRSGLPLYTGINICEILNDGHLGPKLPILGLPKEPKINYVKWSPGGNRLAFTVRPEKAGDLATGLELWVADVATRQAYREVGGGSLFLNTLFHTFTWQGNNLLFLVVDKSTRGVPPKKSLLPLAPKIHSKDSFVQNETYQDLSGDDQGLLDYYGTADLVFWGPNLSAASTGLISRSDGHLSGQPAVYTSIDTAPSIQSGADLLIVSTIRRPFSYNVDNDFFPRTTELWRWASPRYLQDRLLSTESPPHPTSLESVQERRRNITWRPDTSETSLCWVETQEDEDTGEAVSGHDIVYTQSLVDFMNGKTPTVFCRLGGIYRGVVWGDGSIAIVYESCLETRNVRTLALTLGGVHAKKRLLFERSMEDVYSDPVSPMLRPSDKASAGLVDVLAWTTGPDGKKSLLFAGSEATPAGYISFIDLVDTETDTKPERIWKSAKGHFETVLGVMSIQQQLKRDQLRVLISKESPTIPRQYYVNTVWLDKKARHVAPHRTLSNFPHPYPELEELKIETIRYGNKLTATLYRPPDYDADEEGPLPTILWAGPEDFKSGPTRGLENKFFSDMSVTTSPVLWLARRFAVLHCPTLPIIGEEDENSIGSYVDRLVSSAKAAIDAVVDRWDSDPKRIAVGGHSHGASTAVNLLAHAPPGLFCCGIARSGAYDSTPFGFQHKEKNFWEAAMITNTTPFVFENIVKTPLLLIHGEQEINAGALWAERFYKALEGNSAVDARLVVLPLEDDEYRGRENVLQCFWEMDTWLQKHCIDS